MAVGVTQGKKDDRVKMEGECETGGKSRVGVVVKRVEQNL